MESIDLTTAISILKGVVIIIGGIVVVLNYIKQQQFQRLQNLTSIWQKFIDDDKLREIFSLFENHDIEAIKKFESKEKLKFWAILDQVALFSKNDFKNAHYLFQWHFDYVYQNKETSIAFWENIGGIEEIKKEYWAASYNFSQHCKHN